MKIIQSSKSDDLVNYLIIPEISDDSKSNKTLMISLLIGIIAIIIGIIIHLEGLIIIAILLMAAPSFIIYSKMRRTSIKLDAKNEVITVNKKSYSLENRPKLILSNQFLMSDFFKKSGSKITTQTDFMKNVGSTVNLYIGLILHFDSMNQVRLILTESLNKSKIIEFAGEIASYFNLNLENQID